jgi:lipopolysaccharide export system protein LptA
MAWWLAMVCLGGGCVLAAGEARKPAAALVATAAGTNGTVITAQKLTYDYKRSIAVFEGDVVVVDPQMRMTADKMIVVFEGTNSVKTLTAQGNVHITSEDREATCTTAVYKNLGGEVIMTGTPLLKRGRDTLTGDKITFWINEERVVSEPGVLTIFPESLKEKP